MNPETQVPGSPDSQQIALAPITPNMTPNSGTAADPFNAPAAAELLVAEEDLDFLIWLDVQAGEG